MRVLELYCGIGGCAAALGETAEVVAALDVNQHAVAVYRHNHPHPAHVRTLESLTTAELRGWQADLWWLSPPCQPFTRRGRYRDDRDPRTASLLALLPHLTRERPPYLALENVPGFAGSRTHRRLLTALEAAGYRLWQGELCPSELGVPNRRRRFYLVASRAGDPTPPTPTSEPRPLSAYLEPPSADLPSELAVSPRLLATYRHALDRVTASDPRALTACFTSAYGRSPVRSGSYLRDDRLPTTQVRRFSPPEILRLLGFPDAFRLPADLSTRNAWRLVGNSLSLPAVRAALAGIVRYAPPPYTTPSRPPGPTQSRRPA